MSYCRQEGKDDIMFVTKEEMSTPSKAIIKIDDDADEEPGLILPNGDINWNCPCLGGMASGPCGVPFRDAFSCFHYSSAEPKGSDCYESFRKMQDCMQGYPDLYPPAKEDDDGSPVDLNSNQNQGGDEGMGPGATDISSSQNRGEELEAATAKMTLDEVTAEVTPEPKEAVAAEVKEEGDKSAAQSS